MLNNIYGFNSKRTKCIYLYNYQSSSFDRTEKRKYYFPTVLGIDAPEGIKNSIS